jgi:hypothetical protein
MPATLGRHHLDSVCRVVHLAGILSFRDDEEDEEDEGDRSFFGLNSFRAAFVRHPDPVCRSHVGPTSRLFPRMNWIVRLDLDSGAFGMDVAGPVRSGGREEERHGEERNHEEGRRNREKQVLLTKLQFSRCVSPNLSSFPINPDTPVHPPNRWMSERSRS